VAHPSGKWGAPARKPWGSINGIIKDPKVLIDPEKKWFSVLLS